jgi:flagellar protein FliO/FliZ
MTRSTLLTRATTWLAMITLGVTWLAFASPALAFTPAHKGGGESTPLNISPSSPTSHSSGGGPSVLRTIIGLLIVIGVIWGLSWFLRKVKAGRETRAAGTGLSSVATLPLSPGRSLHVVRAGRDYVLVGSSENHIAPIRHYTEEEALEAGLLEAVAAEEYDDEGNGLPTEQADADAGRRPGIPGQPPQNPVNAALDRLREWTVRR